MHGPNGINQNNLINKLPIMTPEAILIEQFFNIANKNGKIVPFHLNASQRHFDESMTGQDIVPKSRQQGFSTYSVARRTLQCMQRDNFNCVIVSHSDEAT